MTGTDESLGNSGCEQWGERVSAAESAYALAGIGERLGGLLKVGLAAREDPVPAGGSPGATEFADCTTDQRELLRDLTSVVAQRFTVAEDLLAATGLVLADSRVVAGIVPLARSATEIAASAAWLLAPELNTPRRLGRLMGQRAKSLAEQAQLPIPEQEREMAKARRKEILSHAARIGVTPEDVPTNTDLVAWAFGDADDPKSHTEKAGRFSYKFMAATTHGTMYALTSMISPVEDANGNRVPSGLAGQYLGQYTTDASRDAAILALPIVVYRRAIVAWSEWTGHNASAWRTESAEIVDALGKWLP